MKGNVEKATLLVVAARLLSYPDEELLKVAPELEGYADRYVSSQAVRSAIREAMRPLLGMKLKDLQELYVETFDYKDSTSLYLTAHEMGDSRKRGVALIELQQWVRDAGYERSGGELPDYIPMLLEFLAVAPDADADMKLQQRLACAIHRVAEHLPEAHPYASVLELLMTFAFDSPSAEELARIEQEREQADLDRLPYPIMYQ